MTDMDKHLRSLRSIAKEAMVQGAALEREAERWRLEAEQAYRDAGDMKAEGRQRAAKRATQMLPSHERAIDVRTNSFKAVQDAKSDFVLYMQISNTYATLAQVKFAKAQAALLEIRTWQEAPLFRSDD